MNHEAPWYSDWAFPLTTALPALAQVAPGAAEPALAGALGCDPASLALGAGVAELVLAIRLSTVAHNERVIVPEGHPWGRFFRGARAIPYRPSGTVDVAAVIAAAQASETEAIVLGLPDPVTGVALLPGELDLLLEATDALLIIDGTYQEFMAFDLVAAAASHERVLLVRPLTLLSQAAPVAYVVGSPALLGPVRDALAPLPALLQSSVHAWLAQIERWQTCVAEVMVAREALQRILTQSAGLRVLSSQGNFVAVQGGGEVRSTLAGAGQPIRPVAAGVALPDVWQLAIVDPEQAAAAHESLLQALLHQHLAAGV